MDERQRRADSPDASSQDQTGAGRQPTRRERRNTDKRQRARISSDLPEENAPGVERTASDGATGGIVGRLQAVAEPVTNVVEPFVDHIVAPVAGAIGSVIGAASQAWSSQQSVVARRVRRAAREPLANLYDLYPEVRLASPRELGLRFVPVEDIRGTAVAGATQRGGDFLPLEPFQGENWSGRWRRILEANQRLQPLPPVDLIKFAGDYWVVDGHNRVAATLYANGTGLDAMVTELIPLDGKTSERPTELLSYMGGGAELRAAAQGFRPAVGLRRTPSSAEADGRDDAGAGASERYPDRERHDSEAPD